jgi:hypothetical protein
MAQTTLGFGIGMILLGVISYVVTGQESVTALIPTFFGIVFVILGFVMRDEAKAKHAGHAAALLAVFGLLGSARGVPGFFELIGGGEVARPAAAVAQTVMAVACAVFIGLGVKSFRDARKARELA